MPENQKIYVEERSRRAVLRRAIIISLILVAIAVGVAFALYRFKLYTDARVALREAKNIKITLEMAEMELTSTGLNIYDETAEGNIRKGALAYVNRIQGDPEGRIRITGYDSQKRKITGFEYELDKYIVRYSIVDNEDTWSVFQIKELLVY